MLSRMMDLPRRSGEPVTGTHSGLGTTEPTADGGAAVEIFCDESGSEGEKLIGGTTDVFAHSSVQVDVDAAAACIEEVRVVARSPATEVKASVVLRERNRRVLEWLLGSAGPLRERARLPHGEDLPCGAQARRAARAGGHGSGRGGARRRG